MLQEWKVQCKEDVSDEEKEGEEEEKECKHESVGWSKSVKTSETAIVDIH